MTAAWVVGAIIFILLLGTYVLQAILIALQVAVWLLANVVFPLIVLLGWLVVLPFRRQAAMAWMREAVRQSKPDQR